MSPNTLSVSGETAGQPFTKLLQVSGPSMEDLMARLDEIEKNQDTLLAAFNALDRRLSAVSKRSRRAWNQKGD